ncbi:uncharacterized protein LOC143866883 [Tasmannia lanceolata]|uniref:uncharacterized protein LOC143866883 n=1 Tax=Tasmannia lanceolata TaxID=3420 RepID=UPI004062DD58
MRIAFSAAIYHIWGERNARIHGEPHNHKQALLRRILGCIRDIILFLKLPDEPSSRNFWFAKMLKFPLFTMERPHKECIWVKPDNTVIKLNLDASIVGDNAGIGGLLPNANGILMGLYSINVAPKPIHILKMEAIMHGLLLAKSKGITDVWIEADSMDAVRIINGEFDCPWQAIPMLKKIKVILRDFDKWFLTHVWREANSAADYLSKFDCPCKGMDIESMAILQALLDLVQQDFLGT